MSCEKSPTFFASTGSRLLELPPKTERIFEVTASTEERAAYARLEAVARKRAAELLRGFKPTSKMLSLHALMLPLRQACSGGAIQTGIAQAQVEVEGDTKPALDTTFGSSLLTSKLTALVEELNKIAQKDQDEEAVVPTKVLVFSQFSDTLAWLRAELPKPGMSSRTITGDMSQSARARALRDFRSDPPTTIFLLSLRAGAVGWNLTTASEVFVLEPCLNPALHVQAIGRVHRMGQTRPVRVTNFIMKDSIESRVMTMLYAAAGVAKPGADATSAIDIDGGDGPAVVAGTIQRDTPRLSLADFGTLFDLADAKTTADLDADVQTTRGAHQKLKAAADAARGGPPVLRPPAAPKLPRESRKQKAPPARAAKTDDDDDDDDDEAKWEAEDDDDDDAAPPPTRRAGLRSSARTRKAVVAMDESDDDEAFERRMGDSDEEEEDEDEVAKLRAEVKRLEAENEALNAPAPAPAAPAPATPAPMIVRIKKPPAPRKPAVPRKSAARPAAPATQKKRKGRAASPASGTPAAPPAKQARVAETADKAPFGALVGRKVNKKFPGSGFYDGVVESIDDSKPATYVIVWEDGMTTTMEDAAVQISLTTSLRTS